MPAQRIAKDLFHSTFVNSAIQNDPGDAGTITANRSPCIVELSSAGAETRTLAAPARQGLLCLLSMINDSGDITLTVTNGYDQTGNTTIVFDDIGDSAALVSVRIDDDGTDDYEWRLIYSDGGSANNLVDLNGLADGLVLDADGDTTLSAPTDDQVDVEVGGTDRFTFVAGGITFVAGSSVAGAGSTLGAMIPDAQQDTIAAGKGGAVSVATYLTTIATDSGGDAFTLANGQQKGQLKRIQMIADAGGDGTLTITTAADENTVTFADVGDYVDLLWNGTAWRIIAAANMADGATAPALSTV